MKTKMSDVKLSPIESRISIKNWKLKVCVGTTANERKTPQLIKIDINIMVGAVPAIHTDNVNDTLDYVPLLKKLKSALLAKQFNLIESVATEVLTIVLKNNKAKSVSVTVKKPAALKRADHAAVKMSRSLQ